MSTTVPIPAAARTSLSSIPTRKSRFNVQLLKAGRQIHLYVGIFSAPALLFFALSGTLQTFSLHQGSKRSDYKPPHWISVMAELHKNQTMQLSPHKALPISPSSSPKPERSAAPDEGPKRVSKEPAVVRMKVVGAAVRHPLPLKIFFGIVSFGFFLSVLTGIYMSYRYSRNRILVTGILLAGLLIPVLLTFV